MVHVWDLLDGIIADSACKEMAPLDLEKETPSHAETN